MHIQRELENLAIKSQMTGSKFRGGSSGGSPS